MRITPKNGEKINLDLLDALYYVDTSKDIDFCEDTFFAYEIKGDAPDLSKETATFILTHKGGIMADLNATLSLGYVNINT